MGAYPTSPRPAFLEWCEYHTAIFEQHALALGLSVPQSLAFKVAVEAAAEASAAQFAAKETAKFTTTSATGKFTDLRREAANVVRIIKGFAELSSDPDSVYALAQVPPPADPTSIPPPGKPTNLLVELSPTTGAITLKWKAINPRNAAGTSYIIRRKLPNQTAFEFVGVTGTKRFTDSTFIAGPDKVEYTVQGQRSDLAGLGSDIITINFGNPTGPGLFIQSAMTSGGAGGDVLKMAA